MRATTAVPSYVGELRAELLPRATIILEREVACRDQRASIGREPDRADTFFGNGVVGIGTTGDKHALARYNPDGTLDATFGNGGR